MGAATLRVVTASLGLPRQATPPSFGTPSFPGNPASPTLPDSTLAGAPPDGGLWTGPQVAAWIDAATEPTTPTWPQLGWVYLRRLGRTPQVPRPRHARAASPEAQLAWQKN